MRTLEEGITDFMGSLEKKFSKNVIDIWLEHRTFNISISELSKKYGKAKVEINQYIDSVDHHVIAIKNNDKIKNDKVEKEENKYKKGVDIFMEYFDSLPDEAKEDIHERLEELGI